MNSVPPAIRYPSQATQGNRPAAFRRRLGRSVSGWLSSAVIFGGAILLSQTAATAAEPFRISSAQLEPSTGRLTLRYLGAPDAYYILHRGAQVHSLHHPLHIRLGPVLPSSDFFTIDPPPAQAGFFAIQQVLRTEPVDSDGDLADDVFELLRPRYFDPLDPTDVPPFQVGTLSVPDRSMFEALARRSDLPGTMDVRELKFLVAGVDTDYPVLYLMNTVEFEFHDAFAIAGLGWNVTVAQYNAETYFTDSRKNVAGSVVAHDRYVASDGSHGLYTIEFWPADPVSFEFVELTYRLVTEQMPFAADRLAYHPTGETHQELYTRERMLYAAAAIPVISTDELLADLDYYPLNVGETFGRLRLITGTETVSVRDILILQTPPNDLSHVSGLITETPQTPLSHVNLKAQQNNTPNAYIRNASGHPRLAPWLGQYVHLQILPDDFEVEPATLEEVETFLESLRPPEPQTPPRNLTVTTIAALTDLGAGDSATYGAKAANVAELAKILPQDMVPHGYAVPFYFYHVFMDQNGLYAAAEAMMADPDFQASPERRSLDLETFRRRICNNGIMPTWMMDTLAVMQLSLPPGTTPRCRSSSNNEDLPGFNGAGLYDSYTHHYDEGHIAKSIRQVWSSLWTYRAFEEREFHRIDHLQAAMGVLVHPNYSHELANGVGVTRNIYDPNWRGFYVNVQLGEDLVTNPSPGSVPDEFLIAAVGKDGAYETQYLRHSSYLPEGSTVLNPTQVLELAGAMELIQNHFQSVYDAETDPEFAMEIEFKITAEGLLHIKQARPWVQ